MNARDTVGFQSGLYRTLGKAHTGECFVRNGYAVYISFKPYGMYAGYLAAAH